MRRVMTFIAVATVVAVMGGCTTGEPTPRTSESIHGLPPGVTQPHSVPVDVPNDAVERLNVALSVCEEVDGGWRAGGEVVNPAERDVEYEVTVFFTTSGGTVIGFGSTRVPVAAGETGSWDVVGEFVAPEGTVCVVRGAAAV